MARLVRVTDRGTCLNRWTGRSQRALRFQKGNRSCRGSAYGVYGWEAARSVFPLSALGWGV